jgi:hypothetical protein
MLYQMPRLWAPIDGATAAPPTPITPRVLDQPDQARFARQQALRYVVSAPRYFDGPPVHQSYLFAMGQPQIRLSYQIPRAKAPIDVAIVAPAQTDIPPATAQPSRSWFVQLERVRSLGGSSSSLVGLTVTAAPTYEFPVNQPELAYQLPLRRLLPQTGPAPQLLGPFVTTAQTYVFPVNQPELAYQPPLRRLLPQTGPLAQLLGQFVTSAQTYVFPVNQADFAREAAKQALRYIVDAPRHVAGATVQQTYEFAPSQPEFRYYVRVTPASPVVPQLGIFVPPQPSYEFTPNQPEMRAAAQAARAPLYRRGRANH